MANGCNFEISRGEEGRTKDLILLAIPWHVEGIMTLTWDLYFIIIIILYIRV